LGTSPFQQRSRSSICRSKCGFSRFAYRLLALKVLVGRVASALLDQFGPAATAASRTCRYSTETDSSLHTSSYPVRTYSVRWLSR